MDREEHREQVVSAMEAVMRKDRTKSFVVGWTKLGLLEMTRKKPGKALRSHLPSLAALAGQRCCYRTMMLTVNMDYDIIIRYVSSDGFRTCCNRSGWVRTFRLERTPYTRRV